MSIFKNIVLVVCIFNVAACSALKNNHVDESTVTRVFVDPVCPVTPSQEAIGELLVGLAIEPVIAAGIKGLGGALKAAGEDKVATTSGQDTSHFYEVNLGHDAQTSTSLNLDMGCITVVNGVLNDGGRVQTEQVDTFLARYRTKMREDDVFNYLSPRDGTGDTQLFSDDIRFFAQYRVDISKDLTAMRFVPIRVISGARIGKSNKAQRDVVVIVSIAQPSKDGAFAIASSNFSNLAENKFFEPSELESMSSGWMPLPVVPEIVAKRIAANAERRNTLQNHQDLIEELDAQIAAEKNESKKVALKIKKSDAQKSIDRLKAIIEEDNGVLKLITPVNVEITLTETQKGNDFLVKLGSYLSESNKTIAGEIAPELNPIQREAAKAKQADVEDTLRITAIDAVAAYEEEEEKTGAERSASKVRTTKIKASQACRKLRAIGQDDVVCVGF
ncbi:hypothetical protein [Vibrio parahaemolyticus]|uniref:hypothetical protein n=1 Tax=Vibrio parahaemolyticus TaxID=670 RepID=UPI00111E2416|nr:hypothetical protein [Vibrio parahaemolyticus]TOQ06404.1 hypothetical protein CGH04_21415 [Vibrio parahaemolyticus]